MSATVMKTGEKPAETALIATSEEPQKSPKHYRGFVAGVFSGIAKLSGTALACNAFYGHIANSSSRPPLRHCQSPLTNNRQVALPRASGLFIANSEEGRVYGLIQGCHTAVGRMDVHGLDVRCFSLTSKPRYNYYRWC